ncbi:MAG: histidine ammonia-lyase [Calditrichaceae bacterium]|nr:histidine ammonia-lyase [Calditrichia bacterium]NUQ43542.1 histidine ammonia-lyase [Calditrichaceae bacterium]
MLKKRFKLARERTETGGIIVKISPSFPDHIVLLDGASLTLENLARVARNPHAPVALAETARSNLHASRAWVETVQKSGEPVVYGVNTGFGSKASVSIPKEKLRELQRNLIMSHAAGAGDPLPIDAVRAAMLLRANTLARGHSGVRAEVVDTLLAMLNKGVTPWIPAQGSLGASGDLAPLSHLALVLSRGPEEDPEELSGQAYRLDSETGQWELTGGKTAMERAGIPRLILEAKEGLALNNGTPVSTALLALACYDARQLVKTADVAMAMTLEALEGFSAAFSPEIQRLRPHPGQVETAENIRRLTENSRLLDRRPERVQDAYSLRCHPQVLAGVRDTLRFIENTLAVEMNAVTDNPLIFPGAPSVNKAVSGGNFHAQPIAFAGDFLSIVLCEVGSIAERRIFRLSDKHLNAGLPSFLAANSGLESGLMIAHYTAASLVSENKSLAHPASVDSLPTCENQEDHVSMAPIAARKARQILENVQKIVGVELLYAAQALDLRLRSEPGGDAAPETLFGKGTAAAYRALRQKVAFLDRDRPVYRDMETARELVWSGELLAAVEDAVGELR